METNQFFEYALITPTGFMCKFCCKEYDFGSAIRIVRHLAKINCHDVDNCLLVPEDVHKKLFLRLRKRSDSTLNNDLCLPSRKRTPLSTAGVHLLATEIVCKQFDKYMNDIWSFLMDDDHVFIIGIHGIGGVGKTQLAKYINNKLLQSPNNFNHVFWVNMSPDWNQATVSPLCKVRDLQNSVSKAVGVDLSDGDDVSKRAAQLTKGLAEKKNSVLILDDVWVSIPLQEVGIPLGVGDGCKVVFTTRSLEVCRQLGCQKKIEIKCLPPDESYELFKKELGNETTLSREVEEMSRLVARKCVGLPLAITIMAKKMKGVTDEHRWRNALAGNMQKKADMEVFQILKISYDFLKDTTLQHCFLYCASLVEENREKKRLAEYLVDEGIIKNMNSRMEQLDGALTLLDFLHDAGLLEITNVDDYVKMNELIRSMALQIMDETQPRAIIKNGMSLKDLPDEESWTEDLVRVTLEGNKIENIPCNFSPSCSNLSTLVLSRNYKLRCIGDLFFEGMPRLKVLDLSHTSIESLPPSVFGLVNLTALLLHMCRQLKNIPSMAELKSLKKLDLSFSGLKKVPEDIEWLSKLTYLDLLCTEITEFNSEILAKLSHLQFLRLNESCAVNGEAVARLVRLETLHCSFNDVVELNKYLVHLKGGFTEREPPLQLYVQVGRGALFHFTRANDLLYDGEDPFAERDDDWSAVGLDNCDINETDLLNYFQDIVIQKCNGARSLCKFSPIKGVTELKHFSIQECDGLEFLCLLSVTGQGVLENIEYMELFFLEKLSVLVRKEGDVAYGHSCFSNLTRFVIQGCPSIKRLFPTNLMPNLKNLKRLYVLDCALMKEIFGAEEEEEERKNIVEKKICCLPKLSILWLADLPRLKRFCGGGAICGLSKLCIFKAHMCPTTVFTDGVAVYDMAQH